MHLKQVRLLLIHLFIICFYFTFNLHYALAAAQEKLPFCDVADTTQRIVLVSTLDGKITALNPNNGGESLWTVHPGHESMLSSSIHRLELTNLGQLVRMIPSLNGGLYKFNGETVEPIPLTADHLLRSSFKYSDDLVISGGKESQTMGVSLRTGEILYECSMKGCKEDGKAVAGDIILVQRLGQVVRAVEPRSGAERWNFSVAQHDVKLLSECHSQDEVLPQLNLKVIVPEGLVCAMEAPDSPAILWKHKFDSPIVSTWEITKGNIFEVDLFSRFSHASEITPSLYIGMHEKQLYIQESVSMIERRKELTTGMGKHMITQETSMPRLPWRPVLANAENAGLELEEAHEHDDDLETTSRDEGSTTALSVLYASPYVDGMGFYLFTKEAIKQAEEAHCNVTIPPETEHHEEEEETPVTIVIVSLWYWWKEVTLISLTTAVIFNFFTRRFYYIRKSGPELPLVSPPASRSDSGIVIDTQKFTESQTKEYVSRYLTDFDPVDCLGKGGFGVVFEAKNKIDDCNYAIKRIVLPDSPESRERVMREVRALAKLDHHNIVRYFNSWMECPPIGWQREQDRLYICDGDSQLTDETNNETATSCFPTPSRGTFASERITNGNCDMSDSFIVFAADSKNEGNADTEQPLCEKRPELSIRIEETESDKGKKKRQKRARPCSLAWVENSSICQSPSKVYLYIQMQLCKRESLKDWLLQNPTRDYQSALNIFEQIVRAVDYVHVNNLIHRDLKPSNIFFSMDQQIKVGDFGLVTTIEDEGGRQSPNNAALLKRHTSQVGTQLYMSPEQLSGKGYSFKVDIFSLGLILLELLVPFSTQMERQRVLEAARAHSFPSPFLSQYKVEHGLLKRMLSHNPDERPTTVDLLTEPPLQRDGHQGGDSWTPLTDFRRHRRESSRTSISSNSSELS